MSSIPRPTWRLPSAVLVAALSALALCGGSLLAQAPTDVETHRVTLQPVRNTPLGIDVPMPPRNAVPMLPKHREPTPPQVDRGIPQPTTPMLRTVSPLAGPDDFTLIHDRVVTPVGGLRHLVGEPAAVVMDNVAFMTGNTWAARSTDGTQNWQHVSPYTALPPAYGGACCDQRVEYLTRSDVNCGIWLIQYAADANGNCQRIAVAQGAANYGNANFAFFYDLTAQAFGFPTGAWLDFPDLAKSNTYLYGTTNVYSAQSRFIGNITWRIRQTDLRDGLPVQVESVVDTGGTAGSRRLTQGATNPMRFAWLQNFATVRVYSWPDDQPATFLDHAVAAITTGRMSAPGPDQRDWAGFADHRILGGYASASEYGFLVHSGPTATRPRPFVRCFRWRSDDTQLVAGDLWHADHAIMFPAACTNVYGHVGIVAAYGGGSAYPGNVGFVLDERENFELGNVAFRPLVAGNSGPAQNRWGDYFTVSRHHPVAGVFVATGMCQRNGPDHGNSEPHLLVFGRSAFEGYLEHGLVVRSNAASVPITVSPVDRQGAAGGAAPFFRGYPRNVGTVTLTAPASYTAGGRVFVFDRWATRFSDAGWFERPQGQLSVQLTFPSGGTVFQSAEARYIGLREVRVTSTLATGVPIFVSPPDASNQGSGSAPLVRRYARSQQVLLSTQPIWHPHRFLRWVVNGVPQPQGSTDLRFQVLDQDVDAVAEYYLPVPRTLTVLSRTPASGAGVAVSPADRNGQAQGTTPFTRSYGDGSTVTLVADPTGGGGAFQRWIINGQAQPLGVALVTVNLTGQDVLAEVDYLPFVSGTFRNFGTGCAAAVTPTLPLSISGVGLIYPVIGREIAVQLRNGPRNAAAIALLGFSSQAYGAVPLPFALGTIGAPGCTLWCDIAAYAPTTTNATGFTGVLLANVPNDRNLIGQSVFCQFLAQDAAANSFGWVFSDGLRATIGG